MTLIWYGHKMVCAPRPSDAKFKGREKWWFPFGLCVVYFTGKKRKKRKKAIVFILVTNFRLTTTPLRKLIEFHSKKNKFYTTDNKNLNKFKWKASAFILRTACRKWSNCSHPFPSYHINVKPSDGYIRVKRIFSRLQQILTHDIKEEGHSQRLGN